MKTGPVVIVAEHDAQGLSPVNRDLSACGRILADLLDAPVQAVVLGAAPRPVAEEMARQFAVPVTAVDNPALKTYCAEAYLGELGALLNAWAPSVVLAGHTGTGCDFAPGLAAALGAACITAVEAVAMGQDRLLFHRAVAGGKLFAGVGAASCPVVITVLPGAFGREKDPKPAGTAAVSVRKGDFSPRRTRPLGLRRGGATASNLTEARVVVSAGNGVGAPENLALLERLAALFAGAAVAGSRPVCDRGWLPYSRQVGITGKVVAPELYIACGISGTSQHVAGMRGSDMVVAINTDPNAAIFNEADIGIVEDLAAFIPIFLDIYDKGEASEG